MDAFYRPIAVIDASSAGQGRYTMPFQTFQYTPMSIAPKNKPNMYFDGQKMINRLSSDISGTPPGMISMTSVYTLALEKFLKAIDTKFNVVFISQGIKDVVALVNMPTFDKLGEPIAIEFTIVEHLM